ncbi:MAG: 30S ribosome-binding factor RbfA [Bryobacteraceae bacterium]
MDPRRAERLTESIRTELEEILQYELNDPRVAVAAVTDVVLSPDGKKAHVRLALEGDAEVQAATLDAIETAKGFVRHLLADRIDVFRVPDLRFDADIPAEVREKAPHLMRKIRRGRPKD